MAGNDSALAAMDTTTGGVRGVGQFSGESSQPAGTVPVPPDATPQRKRPTTSQAISPSKDVPQYGRTAGTVSVESMMKPIRDMVGIATTEQSRLQGIVSSVELVAKAVEELSLIHI